MGLGLHGGGLASARFLARRGARVTVTDNRKDPSVFAQVLPELEALGVRTVLGRHREEDFREAQLVVKNPAVPPSSSYLAAARERGVPIETDLSLFLQLNPGAVIGVTGSKGKSTVAAAIHHCLLEPHPGARLGGNITISPLGFLDELTPGDPVVLELSSWQLADLRGRGVLEPRVALLTVILPDHQDRYPDMESYVADKAVLFEGQRPEDFAVLNHDDPWQVRLAGQVPAALRWFSAHPLPEGLEGAYLHRGRGLLRAGGLKARLLGNNPVLPGAHSLRNLLAAGMAAWLFGQDPGSIERRLGEFPGLEHRLELVREVRGVRFYNDSAATIPEAAAAALESLPAPVLLIAGGTDKNLDFRPLAEAIGKAHGVFLLTGSGTEKLRPLLDGAGAAYQGPFGTLEEALRHAVDAASPGSTVVLSPGCASFEMFLNEFDRGRRFKALVQGLA
ncbi:MAG: UDP-N-acetylmuramoyl-L-alanine--D-glutamate ligase [Spirochaetales bacterium]|nr:UDP-N-acetylmuramoyl-L-alanine--D-glutamate ligase [Spirochaetales bacterium]